MAKKAAIVNKFNANEAFVSASGSVEIIKKGKYRVFNGSEYETVHLQTSAEQVIESESKKFVSQVEKNTWNSKADANHNHDSVYAKIGVSHTKEEIANLLTSKSDVEHTHAASNIIQDSTHRFVTDAEKAKWDDTYSTTEVDSKVAAVNDAVQALGIQNSTDHANITKGYQDADKVIDGKVTTVQGNLDKAVEDLTALINNGGTANTELAARVDTIERTTIPAVKKQITDLDSKLTGVTDGLAENKADKTQVEADIAAAKSALQANIDLKADKTFVDEQLALKANKADVFTKDEVTSSLDLKADKTYVNTELGKKVNTTTFTSELAKKANASEVQTALEGKASVEALETGLSGKAEKAHTHTSSQITGLGTAATKDVGVASGNIPVLNAEGKLESSVLPAIAINETFSAASASEAMGLEMQIGDILVLTEAARESVIEKQEQGEAITYEVGKSKASQELSDEYTTYITSGKIAYLCVDPTADTFEERFKPLQSSGDTISAAEDQASALKLTVEVGDIVIVTADSKTYICIDKSKTVFDEKFKPLGSAADGYTKAEVESLLGNKVDKVSGKGLSTNDFTAAYKTKLDGIATGANNYVHPNDANTRHVTDAEKSTWNNKANANHTHNSLLAINLGDKKVSLNDYTLASGSPNIAYYYCNSDGGGANITGRPNDNAKNAFYLRVELIRWISETDYVSMQTYVKHDEKVMYVRYCNTGVWTAWEKMYTSVQKPTLAELGAAAASHGNHVPTVQTADARKFLRNDNTWQSLPAATTGATGIVQLNDATNSTSTTQAATANAVKKAYDLANSKASSSHGHNNLSTRGAVAMESDTTRPAVSGLSMQEAYNDSYPTTYGNVLSMRGTGDGQLLIGWSGTSGGHAPAYIRSRRDQADAPWSGWAQIYTTAHKPSLTDLGITTLTRGSYLTGSNYNGTAATTWAVDATTTATASKVVARDSNADISCRLVRSNYANQATISGAMAFRVSNSGDDYIRFCSDTGAIRTFLNTYAKSETYARSEMDSRYRQKTDMVFTDTISITTPAA